MAKIIFSIKEVEHLAKLANLPLATREVEKLAKPLSQTIDYVSVLEKLAIGKVAPTSHVLKLVNRKRKDQATACLTTDAALSNSKEKKNNLFVIPPIFEEI